MRKRKNTLRKLLSPGKYEFKNITDGVQQPVTTHDTSSVRIPAIRSQDNQLRFPSISAVASRIDRKLASGALRFVTCAVQMLMLCSLRIIQVCLMVINWRQLMKNLWMEIWIDWVTNDLKEVEVFGRMMCNIREWKEKMFIIVPASSCSS